MVGFSALSPTVEGLIMGLLPWYDPLAESSDTSTVSTVISPVEPPLSPFWTKRRGLYEFLLSNYNDLSDNPLTVVKFSLSSIAWKSLKAGHYYVKPDGFAYYMKTWVILHEFDADDLMSASFIDNKCRFFKLV